MIDMISTLDTRETLLAAADEVERIETQERIDTELEELQ